MLMQTQLPFRSEHERATSTDARIFLLRYVLQLSTRPQQLSHQPVFLVKPSAADPPRVRRHGGPAAAAPGADPHDAAPGGGGGAAGGGVTWASGGLVF